MIKTMQKQPWKSIIRRESGLVELVCEHGVGHPAYGSVDYMGDDSYGIHGCCGCCTSPEWKLADAQQGVKIANHIIKSYQKIINKLQSN